MQILLFNKQQRTEISPFRLQLLKWVGNKQRFANEIASYFPTDYLTYWEPFLGSGAVLGTLQPKRAVGSDNYFPLFEIWSKLKESPDTLKSWYADRWHKLMTGNKNEVYEQIKATYNKKPNGADLLFLCRTCYGGIVRFRQSDGHMSTPCGVHTPISPKSFSIRVDTWHRRTSGTIFKFMDFSEAMESAKKGDIVYCDPPYRHTQTILYGAQAFNLERLIACIDKCKSRGVRVALSIDGTKQSGKLKCDLPIPEGLFERQILVNCGRSMLKRFQMEGQSLEHEVVEDRLLLTY